MERVEIKKGWFWSAGETYGWVKKDYDKRGVGIKIDTLKFNREIEISVSGVLYLLNCSQALTFIGIYKSIQDYKGTKVGIVSKSLLQTIFDPNIKVQEEVFPQVSPTEVLQSKLF